METQALRATLVMLNDRGAFPALDAKLASALSAILSGEMMRAIKRHEGTVGSRGKAYARNTDLVRGVLALLDLRDRVVFPTFATSCRSG